MRSKRCAVQNQRARNVNKRRHIESDEYVSPLTVACSRLGPAELRKREDENKTFRVPFSFASSPLSESLEQATLTIERDKKQRRRTSLEEKHENSYSGGEKMRMLEATEVKMSGSDQKKANRNTYAISSIKSVTRKFHVVVEQNNGKDIYKKSVLRVQRCVYLLIKGVFRSVNPKTDFRS